jgi:hypothetical protein
LQILRSEIVKRAVAALVVALTASLSVSAQVNMPNPSQISGVPLPAQDLPAGSVSVRVIRGGFDKNVPDQPVVFTIDGTKKVVKTDAQGRAQVDKIKTGAIVTASTNIDGSTLTSQQVTIAASGIRFVLVAIDPEAAKRAEEDKRLAAGPAIKGSVVFGPESRVVIEPGDEIITIFYVLDIVNSARTPVDIGGPLVVHLPTGARAAGVVEGSTPQAKINGPKLTVLGPFAPGTTSVQMGYELPTGSDSTKIVQMWPVAMPQSSIVLQRTGSEDLVSPQVSQKNETTSNGQRVVFGRLAAVPAGGAMTVEVTGLAHHSRVPRNIALTLVVGLMALGLREGFRRA